MIPARTLANFQLPDAIVVFHPEPLHEIRREPAIGFRKVGQGRFIGLESRRSLFQLGEPIIRYAKPANQRG
jgi:hypothetical protein